ncbi:hypothetical protein L2E82_30087 [Cichorium intybus]|uniref:Uncharacterized protein n=1 Tax=Cichorium intybus TaxID=13427 RepID=A0ACB9CZS6_CICIN|nr:hypothetical protein L2E82_30087 [Cichorium intybus]
MFVSSLKPKSTKRAGWVKRDITGPESIADHMYRMGLMALIASDTPGINRDMLEGTIHYMGSQSWKRVEWRKKHLTICANFLVEDHKCITTEEIYELWMEYEENSTNEAKVVKDFDKIEMILQALEYEKGKFSGV